MQIENEEYELRIVKVFDGSETVFEIRCQAPDGFERHVGTWYSAELARKDLDAFKGLSADAKIAALALYAARHLAGRIAYTSDELGSGLYATKSHMRAWAKEIFDTLNSTADVLAQKSSQEVQRRSSSEDQR